MMDLGDLKKGNLKEGDLEEAALLLRLPSLSSPSNVSINYSSIFMIYLRLTPPISQPMRFQYLYDQYNSNNRRIALCNCIKKMHNHCKWFYVIYSSSKLWIRTFKKKPSHCSIGSMKDDCLRQITAVALLNKTLPSTLKLIWIHCSELHHTLHDNALNYIYTVYIS